MLNLQWRKLNNALAKDPPATIAIVILVMHRYLYVRISVWECIFIGMLVDSIEGSQRESDTVEAPRKRKVQ